MAGICLVGAAVLTSLLAAAVCGRWLLRGAAAVRPYLLAFLVFAAVAMNFAQKSGTNRVAVAEAGECNMSFDYNGSTCTFPIRVVAPNGIAGTKVIDDGECMGDVIGAGFLAQMQVLPTYVSFAFGLRIMEDVAPMSGKWGCFQNSTKYPPSQFAHTEARGALNPLRILSENIVEGLDHVQTILGELQDEDGGYTLNIPMKWGVDGGPYGHDAGDVPMTIHVQTDGTVSVSKFGITARRKQNEYYQ